MHKIDAEIKRKNPENFSPGWVINRDFITWMSTANSELIGTGTVNFNMMEENPVLINR
jgi:hypothetical protein